MTLTQTADSRRPGARSDLFEILVQTHARGSRRLSIDEDLTWLPATDAYETEDAFVVQMDLSGMDPSDIEVRTEGRTLTVAGARRDIAPPGRKHYHKMEISVGPFARSIELPAGISAEGAEARYESGFLFVSFRKGDPRSAPRRRIEVDDR